MFHRTTRRLLAAVCCSAATIAALSVTTAPAHAGQVGVTPSIQGSGSISVVEGTLEEGPTTCDRTANLDDRVTLTCPRLRNEETFEAWVWLRPTAGRFPVGHWSFKGWRGCDETRTSSGVTECGVHSTAFGSVERAPVAVFDDTMAPTLASIQVNTSTTTDNTASFVFTANEGSTHCRFDYGAYEPCGSNLSRTFRPGSHRIDVYAVDSSGNASVDSSRDFTVVSTRITTVPGTTSHSSNGHFNVLSDNPGATLWCAFSGDSTYTPCTNDTGNGVSRIPFTGLADGEHTFYVYAQVGEWVDRTPATYTWTIDTAGPETTITSATTEGTSATFTFDAPGATRYDCTLRHGQYYSTTPCTSPKTYNGLTDDDYTFEVVGYSPTGAPDPTPAVHRWSVDTTPNPNPNPNPVPPPVPTPDPTPDPTPLPAPDTTAPETAVTDGPSSGAFTTASTATFALGANEQGTFACDLDGATLPCSPTLTLSGLAPGTHVLQAAAIDAAGNRDATPSIRTWTVTTPARDLTATKGFKQSATGAVARRKGAALTTTVTGATRLALVATRGRGKVIVRVGSRTLAVVALNRLAAGPHIIPLRALTKPYSGRIRIVSGSDRSVRILGLGVATR